jgi:riboflavin synthase
MFTGLVQHLASVREIRALPPGKRFVVHSPQISRDAALGDSIAVNGC